MLRKRRERTSAHCRLQYRSVTAQPVSAHKDSLRPCRPRTTKSQKRSCCGASRRSPPRRRLPSAWHQHRGKRSSSPTLWVRAILDRPMPPRLRALVHWIAYRLLPPRQHASRSTGSRSSLLKVPSFVRSCERLVTPSRPVIDAPRQPVKFWHSLLCKQYCRSSQCKQRV